MDDNILYNQGNEKEKKMFTSEEIIQIYTCMIMRRNEIKSLENNEYVSAGGKDLMSEELRIMESVEKKLWPSVYGK